MKFSTSVIKKKPQRFQSFRFQRESKSQTKEGEKNSIGFSKKKWNLEVNEETPSKQSEEKLSPT